MDVILASDQAQRRTLSAMVGFIEQRTAVCAKVLNRAGEVIAINKRGLDLLDIELDDICDSVWTSFWSGDERTKAEHILTEALSGRPARFEGRFDGLGHPTLWEVEAFPLERDADGKVDTILVVSINVTDRVQEQPAICRDIAFAGALSEAVHSLMNLSNVNASSARMLARRSDDPLVQELCDGLQKAGRSAQDVAESLRRLIADA